MNSTWYELEVMHLDDTNFFYTSKYDLSDTNAGYDVFSIDDKHITKDCEFISFGISARLIKVEKATRGNTNEYIKSDSHFWLVPRSSIYKSGLMMANSIGVIDKTYRGELKAPVWSITGNSTVQRGQRLFQIVAPDMGWIRNIKIVDSMTNTDRGTNGFGSSGN